MEQEKKISEFMQSSMDPATFSNTVRGIALIITSPIILQFASTMFGVVVPEGDATVVVDDLANIATQVAVVAGGVWGAYGLTMKLVVRVNAWIVNRK